MLRSVEGEGEGEGSRQQAKRGNIIGRPKRATRMKSTLMAAPCYTHSERVTISNHQRTPEHKLISSVMGYSWVRVCGIDTTRVNEYGLECWAVGVVGLLGCWAYRVLLLGVLGNEYKRE